MMGHMPKARILIHAEEVPDELVAAHRLLLEASDMRALGEPEIRNEKPWR